MTALSTGRRNVMTKLVEDGSWLNWDGSEWWIESRNDKLHASTCHWLVRNGYIAWDKHLNEGDIKPIGFICYTPTRLGIDAVTPSKPKSKVIPFRKDKSRG